VTNAALYLRTSTNDQHPENQLPALERYCYDHSLTVKAVFVEQESAWRNGHQAELARLLAELRSGKRKYDRLIIWSLDRLTRGGIGQLFSLVHTFRQYGCQVVSIQEPCLESAGPAGDLLLAVTGWIAEFESKRRSERTLAGLERALANGKKLGRPVGKKDGKKRRKKRPVVFKYGGPNVAVSVE
jgi:DNA invertase Pin-like site-specific DNA recombinase